MLGSKLATEYEKLYSQKPLDGRWAQVPPAIPFVGRQYGALGMPKVLVYASAENLNHTFAPGTMTFTRNQAMHRRWKAQEFNDLSWSKDNWFPWVHMASIADGTLLTAARYLLHVHGLERFSKAPNRFLEQIAVGNFGKFSLAVGRNRDHASHRALLATSWPFVSSDLRILQPDILILPRTIHLHGLHPLLRATDNLYRPRQIWMIYHTDRRVIAAHIERQLSKAGVAKGSITDRAAWIQEWTRYITRASMRRYLDWIDWRMGRVPGQMPPDWLIDSAR